MGRTNGRLLDRRACRRAAPAIVLAALLVGCVSDPATTNGVSAVQFQDVVVPSGLRLRDAAHESHSREDSGFRIGHFVYEGDVDLTSAVSYVRERMPQHSWSKTKDEEAADGGLELSFERGIYKADYSFTRADGSTVMVVDYTTDYSRR